MNWAVNISCATARGWLLVGVLVAFLSEAFAQGQQYRPFELTFTSVASYTNPFDDSEVDFTVEFTGPNSEEMVVIGFWDGGSTWKARFNPPTAGTWTYVTSCSNSSDTGLDNLSGSFSVAGASGSLPTYQHGGILRRSGNGRYFTYSDGTPFFYVGDTMWSTPCYRMPIDPSQNGSLPAGKTFDWAIDQRVAQGFTVLQMHGSKGMYEDESDYDNSNKTFEKTDNIADLGNPLYTDIDYWQLYDQYMTYADSSGLVVNLGVAGVALLDPVPLVDLKRHYRYMLARFGAYNFMWLITQEYNASQGDVAGRAIKIFALCEYLKSIDCHGRLLGLHQSPVGPDHTDPSWDMSWSDMIIDQNGHFRTPDQGDYLYNYFKENPDPIVEAELNYEGFTKTGFVVDSEVVRQSAYTAIQSGAAGYGYGATGVYSGSYDGFGQPTNWGLPIPDWWDKVALDGAFDMGRLRDFYEGLEWWELEPTTGVPSNLRLLVKSDGYNTILVWFPAGATYSTGTLLPGTAYSGASYVATWFNPRTGATSGAGTIVVSSPGLELPARPDSSDWMLLLEYSGGGVPPPVPPVAIDEAFAWHFDSDAQGWSIYTGTVTHTVPPGIGVDFGVSGGKLVGDIITNTPRILSPDSLGGDLASMRFLKIRMKNESSSVHGKVFFTTTSEPGFPDSPQKQFLLKPKDAGYSDYLVDMWDAPGWSGTLKQISIGLGDGTRSGVTVGYPVGVDYIKIGGEALSAPAVPVGVTATGGYEQISLSWSASQSADFYTIKRSQTAGGPYATIVAENTSSSYLDEGLDPGVIYYYIVEAVNGYGRSMPSSEVSDLSAFPPAPSVVGGMALNVADSSLVLDWTAVPYATSYSVKRSGTFGGGYTAVATGLSAPGFIDTAVSNGTSYHYIVTAVNSTAESSISVEVAGVPVAAEVVIDNTASSGVNLVGLWTQSAASPGYYGSNYLTDGNAGGGKSASFVPSITTAGLYDVSLIWTAHSNRASNVPVELFDGVIAAPSTISQRTGGGVWNLIGTVDLQVGAGSYVKLTNEGANGFVIADAAKFSLVLGKSPTITNQPESVAVDCGEPSSLTVSASGSGSLVYRWFRNGVAVADDGVVSGASSSTLTMSSTRHSDAGIYAVVVSDTGGATASSEAVLTVN